MLLVFQFWSSLITKIIKQIWKETIKIVNYNFTDFLQKRNEKQISEMTNQEIYYKLLEYVKERADEKRKYIIFLQNS